MRLLFLFLILFSSYSYSEQDWNAVPSTYPDSVGVFSFDTYPPYHPTNYQGARLHIGQCNAWQGSQVCFWADGRVWHSVELIPDEPPPDPYACAENLRRITFDSNPSFCSSANSCSDIIDYALAYDYQNGRCTDSRNISENSTCGDQSILCWTSDDQTNTPVVTTMDGPPTSNTNPEGVPTTTLVESNTDDPDVTYDTITKTVEQPDGSTVTETTTTETNNLTGETSTSSNSVTTTPDGEMSVSVAPSTTSNEDQTEASASGGDSCAVAPSCSGDPVNCLTAKQVWLNRCDGPDVSGSASSCDGSFSCDADALTCVALKFENDQFCEAQDFADTLSETDLTDALDNSQTELENELGQLDDPVNEDGVLTALEPELTPIDEVLNLTAIFNPSPTSGTCPSNYDMNLLGSIVSFSYAPFCNVLTTIRPLVILLFSWIASLMLFRGISESL
jgi:hypothetical protein